MPKRGWKHPITGEHIDPSDDRLIGQGNPPGAPGPVGMGRFPLIPVMMTEAQSTAAEKKAAEGKSKSRRRSNGFPQYED